MVVTRSWRLDRAGRPSYRAALSPVWPHEKLQKNFQLFISSVQNAHYRYCEEIDREIFWWRTIEGVIFAPR